MEDIVKRLLAIREWHRFDCKRAKIKPADLLKTVVAFANTDGGTIVIGMEDPAKAAGDKRMIGISESPDNVSEFLKLINKEISPFLKGVTNIDLDIANVQGKQDKLVIISVDKSDEVHSLRSGDTYVRKGNQNVKITADEITRLRYEKGAVKFEANLSLVDNLDDLDSDLLQQYRADTGATHESDWQFLKDNGLAAKQGDTFYLTNAGVLLLGKNPAVLLARKCSIKISHYIGKKADYSGTPNFARRPFSIEGPLLVQITKTIDYFREVVRNSPPKLSKGLFEATVAIPEWAFQEAITNAVIHRNYHQEDDIQVRFFDDRIEVESPGTYPGHINVNNIRLERYSRNPIIQRTLSRFQQAPNLDVGEGVDRLYQVMKENNLYDPLFVPAEYRPHSVVLVLFNLQRIEYWDTVNMYLEQYGKITNSEARKITAIKDSVEMSRMLSAWVERGLLDKKGESKKSTYYVRPGYSERLDLFTSRDDNK